MDRDIVTAMNKSSESAKLDILDSVTLNTNNRFETILESDRINKNNISKDFNSLYWSVRIYNYLYSTSKLAKQSDYLFYSIIDSIKDNDNCNIFDHVYNAHELLSDIIILPPTILNYIELFKVKDECSNKIPDTHFHLLIILSTLIHKIPTSLLALAIIDGTSDCNYLHLLDEYCQENVERYKSSLESIIDECKNLLPLFNKHIISEHNINLILEKLHNRINNLDTNHKFIGPKYTPHLRTLAVNALKVCTKDFVEENKLGEGTYGIVSKVQGINNYVVKKFRVNSCFIEFIHNVNLKHPNISDIKCINILNPKVLYFEKACTSLAIYIANVDTEMNKDLIRSYMIQIMRAINHCHINLVAHCDIKPSNIVIYADGGLKLIDFGLACKYNPWNGNYYDGRTTKTFSSPEIRKRNSFTKINYAVADIWAIGMVMLCMLTKCKHPIFVSSDLENVLISLDATAKTYNWKSCVPNITDIEQDFLSKLLEYDPEKRINSNDAFSHPYISTPFNNAT